MTEPTENTVADIVTLIAQNARDTVPHLEEQQISASDSLRDLGANSIDRSEIIMTTMQALAVKIPLIEFAKAENIGELAGIFHEKL